MDQLFPAEQARIVQLLVERVDVDVDGISIRLSSHRGIGGLRTAAAAATVEGTVMFTTETNSDGSTLTVRVPLTIKNRGGRKVVISPAGEHCCRHLAHGAGGTVLHSSRRHRHAASELPAPHSVRWPPKQRPRSVIRVEPALAKFVLKLSPALRRTNKANSRIPLRHHVLSRDALREQEIHAFSPNGSTRLPAS